MKKWLRTSYRILLILDEDIIVLQRCLYTYSYRLQTLYHDVVCCATANACIPLSQQSWWSHKGIWYFENASYCMIQPSTADDSRGEKRKSNLPKMPALLSTALFHHHHTTPDSRQRGFSLLALNYCRGWPIGHRPEQQATLGAPEKRSRCPNQITM